MTTAPIRARAVLTIPDHLPVAATWYYYVTDPLAVRLFIATRNEWCFARSLLSDVFQTGHAAGGDVTLRVTPAGLVIDLSSLDGHATLTGDLVVAWEFLARTFQACLPCPTGRCPKGAARCASWWVRRWTWSWNRSNGRCRDGNQRAAT
jgi:sporulation and cell division protein SsgA